ncbi:hypothetical protein PA598K_00496 [Paenibacillus sp. 598K]|nr:hypothetical protein PA598K_00496 [Paenibacillus sp. 598K]
MADGCAGDGGTEAVGPALRLLPYSGDSTHRFRYNRERWEHEYRYFAQNRLIAGPEEHKYRYFPSNCPF